MKTNGLLNLYALSRELNLPAKWLKAKAIEGKIPCLKVGRRLKFNEQAVKDALLDMASGGEHGTT